MFDELTINHHMQAAGQGIAVLMASASVVLRHETSTLRQSHNFISIDFAFGVGDNARGGGHQTCQTWFGSDERSRHHMGGNIIIRVPRMFVILQQSYSPYP